MIARNAIVGEAMSLPPVFQFPYRSISVHVGAICDRPPTLW